MSGQLRHLLRKRFQFSRAGYQRVDLAGQHVTREVRVDRLDDLIVVVPNAGNLGDVLVQPDDVALLRGVGPDHTERLVEDSPDDEAAAVVLQARPSQHPLEADMLLLGQLAGTKRRTADRSFPASKILRGSLRQHTVFKVQYYDAAARAANPSDGLRRSGAASRFGGHDGVLSCGRKHERTDAGSSAAVLPPVRADKTDSPRTFSDKFVNE